MIMKRLFYILLCAASVSFVASCAKVDHAQNQKVTYYPTLELAGASLVKVEKGGTYTDPGYYAELKGVDVTDQVVVKDNIDVNTSGVYTVSYTITNEDGFSAVANRTVVVLDPAIPAEGVYATDPASYRLYNSAQVAYGKRFTVVVLSLGGDKYSVDDLLAGWYAQRAGYGSNYAMAGEITIAGDGTITMDDSLVPGWGDSATALTNGKFDAATKTISYDLEYTDYPFHFIVTMTQI